MRTTGFLLYLLVVGFIAQSALCSSKSRHRSSYRFDEEFDSEIQRNPVPFRAGEEYTFEYNGQVASGLIGANGEQTQSAPANSYDSTEFGEDAEKQQKAVFRISSKAKITFNSEHRATLRLEQTRFGQLNHAIVDAKRVQPVQMFDTKSIEEKKEHELQLPCEFSYVNGVVERIQFHPEDMPWSKNIKRAVLNLIQVNVNGKNVNSDEKWDDYSVEEKNKREQKMYKAFTVPEKTIEGDCLTTYTVIEDKYENDEEKILYNVTKSINFNQCKQISDIGYGFQGQDQQSVKCARINAQQQHEKNDRETRFADVESCDPKEINNEKLDRSTVQRFELFGKSSNLFAIKRAESLSHYTLKNIQAEVDEQSPSAMHTVVVTELIFRGVKPSGNSAKASHYQLKQLDGDTKADSLLFDNEWEIESKRFFMYGDAEVSRESSPYRSVQRKVERAQAIYRHLMQASSDKTNGVEYETVSQLQLLIDILRMCSVDELRMICKNVHDNAKETKSRAEIEKAQHLLADTLAIAGTRNTVYMLTQKILSKEFSTEQATQALKNLHGIPAPSDVITDIVAGLCKNELVHRSSALKETCWLTFGSMVGELCRDKISAKAQQQEQGNGQYLQQQTQQWLAFGVQSGFEKSHVCPPMKKESYKQTLLHQYKQAETTYEKVLALKAIGNAGLDTIVNELERIVSGELEKRTVVRVVAIDALRRLRTQMPRKIQRVCLPIFQNIKEKSEIRMAAISLLMSTHPEQQIVDQIAYTLSKERSEEVQAFCYSIVTSMLRSNIPQNLETAKHLKSALKLANFNEETETASKKWQMPLYSNNQQEGFSLKWTTVFGENQMLPSHIAAGLDTLWNGKFQGDIFKISMTQQGANRWIENLMQVLDSIVGKQRMQTRGSRAAASSNKRADQEFRDIVTRLNIKDRREQGQYKHEEAFAMVSVRFGDVDYAILPLGSHNLPQWLKKVLEEGEELSLASVFAEFASSIEKKHIRILNAVNLHEKLAKIPTPIGLPLTIQQSTPTLYNFEASAKMQPGSNDFGSSQVKAQVQAHITTTLAHIQKMEIWTPVLSTGVESVRGLEFNVPLHLEVQAKNSQQNKEGQNGLRLAWKVPQAQKTRLFGAHTMCSTFVINNNKKEIRSIHNPVLEHSLPVVEMNKVFGDHRLGMPIRVNGHFHLPNEWSNYAQIAQIVMATENHIHIDLEPSTNTPREIVLRAEGSLFQKIAAQQHELHNFYSDAEQQFLPTYTEDVEGMEVDDNAQRRQKLSKTLERLQKQQNENQMYKHSLKLSIEANGHKQVKAEVKFQAMCDAKFLYCKMFNEINRTPIYIDETSNWTLKQKIQTLLPESVSSLHELKQLGSQKNQKCFIQIENEWGTEERTQFINIRIHGEKAHTKEQHQQLESSTEQKQYLKKYNIAFINKYDLVADYKLKTETQNVFQRLFEVLKSYYFWNTESRIQQAGRDGQLFATVVIEPVTQRQCNVSVRTPSQAVRITNARLPIRVRPNSLVRATQKTTHSVSQVFSRINTENRAECRVDGRRVETFDDVMYRAPITQCYSVLAKDCNNVEKPKFAVLMKSLTENGQQKKIKVITPQQVIECQPREQQTGNWKNHKIVCSINDQEITAEQQLTALSTSSSEEEWEKQTVEYNNDEQTSVTIRVSGVSVRFGCQCANCECQRATIKLSELHKNSQCGLCGHYDDSLTDEWRMSNNELTNDLAKFHRSYSLNDDMECTESKQDEFYSSNKENFRVLDNNWKTLEMENTEERDEETRYGGYAEENDSAEQWDQSSYRQINGENVEEPIMKTKVLEQNQRICFSVKQIKQCRSGTVSEYNNEMASVEYKFACLSRLSSEARRLQNEIRRGQLVDVSSLEPNFLYYVAVPTQCVRF